MEYFCGSFYGSIQRSLPAILSRKLSSFVKIEIPSVAVAALAIVHLALMILGIAYTA